MTYLKLICVAFPLVNGIFPKKSGVRWKQDNGRYVNVCGNQFGNTHS